MKEAGLAVKKQENIAVYYNGAVVGNYCVDLVVENLVICELKAGECIAEKDEAQLVSYLKATGIEVGLLLNFGQKPDIRRKVFDVDKKRWRTIRTFPLNQK